METLNSNQLLSLNRSRTSQIQSYSRSTNRTRFHNISTYKYQRSSNVLSNSLAWSNINRSKNYMGEVIAKKGNDKVEASAATPGPSSGNPWCNWLVGIILSLILPFGHKKWSGLLAMKNEVDTVVQTVEMVVETVEKVAEGVAHVADEVANQLPEGGKLQNIVCHVANMAEETAKDAHLVDQLIEKVENIEKGVVSAFVGEVDETSSEDAEDTTKTNEQEQKHDIAMDIESPKDEIVDRQPK
ncbi:uncharacterized protein LOC104896204 [Beta vulgaris subsp. vulgaris]|uniref:uncharacterized protein LOC104896204 n=1 Tax=Beta vulgaris subsp. vulgaris TaxID=3555 RepID=UPI00203736A4|nr:uncharacterized protein LOC104896204 [Beta vulgaris subsp. vulgaris]